jgi:hypothetical protein
MDVVGVVILKDKELGMTLADGEEEATGLIG